MCIITIKSANKLKKKTENKIKKLKNKKNSSFIQHCTKNEVLY